MLNRGVTSRFITDRGLLEGRKIQSGLSVDGKQIGLDYRAGGISYHARSRLLGKRIFDVLAASLLLVLFSPIFILLGIWIPLDSSGSAFYRQKRRGFHHAHFWILKFRTMSEEAHILRTRMFSNNESGGIIFKMRRDPRITRLGRFLRRYSLDELPQLFNVLRGEMSLVGPRPFSIEVFKRGKVRHSLYDRWLHERHRVPPGMTGLWQVSGRNELLFSELMEFDIYYVSHCGFWMDFMILMRTLRAVLNHRGAY